MLLGMGVVFNMLMIGIYLYICMYIYIYILHIYIYKQECHHLDGPTIRNVNWGRFARIDCANPFAEEEKTIFMMFERFARIASNLRFANFLAPRNTTRKIKGVRFGNPVRRPRMSGRRMSGTSWASSQTFLELRFPLGNLGKDGKNLISQTWPGTPRRPSPRHPRPPDPETIRANQVIHANLRINSRESPQTCDSQVFIIFCLETRFAQKKGGSLQEP